MPLEKEGFRNQLERLDKRFSGREVIAIKEAAELLGICRDTLVRDKTFPKKKLSGKSASKYGGVYVVPLAALARWLA